MKKFLIAFCLCFLWCGVSNAACVGKTPLVTISVRKSMPKYYSKPSEEVQKACPVANYVPVGCTQGGYSFKYDYKISDKKECKQITSVKMQLYNEKGSSYVYIDDKYPKDSCEYDAIKKHENMHVKINQTVRKKKMKKMLETCLLELNKKGIDPNFAERAIEDCVRQAYDWNSNTNNEKNKKLDLNKDKQPPALGADCLWKK